MLWALQPCSPYLDAWFWCFGFVGKAFLSTISLKLMFTHEMRQTWIPIIISFVFLMGTTIMFFSLGYTILKLCICKKIFFSTIFPIIKFHSWNETNFYTHNSLHSFRYWNYNQVIHIGIHDYSTHNKKSRDYYGYARLSYFMDER